MCFAAAEGQIVLVVDGQSRDCTRFVTKNCPLLIVFLRLQLTGQLLGYATSTRSVQQQDNKAPPSSAKRRPFGVLSPQPSHDAENRNLQVRTRECPTNLPRRQSRPKENFFAWYLPACIRTVPGRLSCRAGRLILSFSRIGVVLSSTRE